MSVRKLTRKPRLQQFIQLYCYLYITDTLYSGEIIVRILNVSLCDVPRGHGYWRGSPESGGGGLQRGGLWTAGPPLTQPDVIAPSKVGWYPVVYLPAPADRHLAASDTRRKAKAHHLLPGHPPHPLSPSE